jgi:hypothetical protein
MNLNLVVLVILHLLLKVQHRTLLLPAINMRAEYTPMMMHGCQVSLSISLPKMNATASYLK